MNTGGEAAEQIVRMSLNGFELATKITGAGAKNIAVLLYAILKEEKKTKGKARLTSMLRSGKALKVYTVKNDDLKKFTQEAKKYGVLYCVLADRKDKSPHAVIDVIARAEDASKISRIVERFHLASVDTASIVSAVEQSKEHKNKKDIVDPQITNPDKEEKDKLLEELFGKPMQKEEVEPAPFAAKAEKSPLSEPFLERPNEFVKGVTLTEEKPSVREILERIREHRKEKKEKDLFDLEKEPSLNKSKKQNRKTEHKQPKRRKKTKKQKVER
jgi:hypothetical protein